MRFFTPSECSSWCENHQIPLDDLAKRAGGAPHVHTLRCRFPQVNSKFLWLSRRMESALQPRQDCLVWVTASGIFPSGENYHLYYRLRESYHDYRLLDEAPGHLCLGHEQADVVTLIYLCLLFAWDAHLLPSVGYARGFVSHDAFIRLEVFDKALFEKTAKSLQDNKLDVETD